MGTTVPTTVRSTHDHTVYPQIGGSAGYYRVTVDYQHRGVTASATVTGQVAGESEVSGMRLPYSAVVRLRAAVGGVEVELSYPPGIARVLAEQLLAAADVADGITA